MARRREKEKAIELRKKGMSYSQIKGELGISKSTLSGWLSGIPLSKNRLRELQQNESVIEKIRLTKKKRREARLCEVFDLVSNDIGKISEREFFIAGFFLYWAEGGKTQPYAISLSNTDPSMIRCYLHWLSFLDIPKKKIVIRLHLYSDMDIQKEIEYWSKEIKLSKKHFRKPYVKKSKFSTIAYTTFGHGTCNVVVTGRDVSEYVLQGLKKISSLY